MMNFFRRVVSSVLPQPFKPTNILRHRVYKLSNHKVMQGPFIGMDLSSYLPDIYMPLLLGTWEIELHDLVRKIQEKKYKTIVNIGAAEGYYSVGFARLFPESRVIAYESRSEMHHKIQKLAEDNFVQNRIFVSGECSRDVLIKDIDEFNQILMIVDIEGGEAELLNPQQIPGLRQCSILVEEHEQFFPGVLDLLINRFSQSHTISIVPGRPRRHTDLPYTTFFTRSWLMRMTNEGRGRLQSWLFMEPKADHQ